jgi:phage terminase large subunit
MKKPVAPTTVEITYKPNPKQSEFHGLDHKYRLFDGGFGNGKTSAGCAEALALALEYPGCTGLVGRKTRPELKASTQYQFFNGGQGGTSTDWTGCPQELIKSFNKTEGLLTLVNGSRIHFWPLDEVQKFTNINLGWFLIDQAEEVPEEIFQMLQGRLRQRGSPRKGILLANPEGHNWLWRRWVYLKEAYPDHGHVHAKTTDNPNLPSDYIEALLKYPESWRKRYMDGSYDVFTGQIWPEYDPEVHEVTPFPLEQWWEIAETIDHGRRNPTAVLWGAFDEAGNCFIFDEHLEAGKLVNHHAQIINEKREMYGDPEYTVIDAQAAQQDPNTGRSVVDEYWDYGIQTVPSDRHRIAGINRVAEWLRLDPSHPHPLTGKTRPEGYPRIYFFKGLPITEHLPQYKWKPKPPTQEADPKEEPLEKDDHDVDALRYLLMTRPDITEKPKALQIHDPRSRRYWERFHDKIHNQEAHEIMGSEF